MIDAFIKRVFSHSSRLEKPTMTLLAKAQMLISCKQTDRIDGGGLIGKFSYECVYPDLFIGIEACRIRWKALEMNWPPFRQDS